MLGFFITLALASNAAAAAAAASVVFAESEYKLELVQTLFRHGDRIVDLEGEVYPNDVYNATDYWPYGYGQLTNKGKQREYRLGQMLRARYGEFLGETYEPGEVYAYSTDQDRTKMSLQLVLAALYPPSPDLVWNENINWMPMPVYYNPRKYDFLSVSEQCAKFEELFNEAVASPKIQKKLQKQRKFIEYLSIATGLPNQPSIAVNLYHTIRSQMSLGLPMPNWCTQSVFEKLEDFVSLRFSLHAYSPALKKLSAGPTIRRFLRNIDESEWRNATRKIYLYSGHDNNLSPFLRAHDLDGPKIVDYGSAAILEKLRGEDGRVYVRMLFWTGVGERLVTMRLQGCGEVCPLQDYLRIVRPALPPGEGTSCLYKGAKQMVKDLISGTYSNDPVNKRLLVYVDDASL